MEFISRYKNHSVVLVPTRKNIVRTVNRGDVAEVVKGIRVRFNPYAEPFFTQALSGNYARGACDSAVVAKANNCEEQEIIDGLMSHKKYGIDFVAVDNGGYKVGDHEKFITRNEDGTMYCQLCDVTTANAQGMNGHKRSTDHKLKLEDSLREGDPRGPKPIIPEEPKKKGFLGKILEG